MIQRKYEKKKRKFQRFIRGEMNFVFKQLLGGLQINFYLYYYKLEGRIVFNDDELVYEL